jgi:hypothetical protein
MKGNVRGEQVEKGKNSVSRIHLLAFTSHSPELGTDLVTTLTSLEVYNLTHLTSHREDIGQMRGG